MAKVRVICNTSPIIGLLAINRLELLEKLFDEIYIPEAVYRELCINAEKYSHEVEQIHKKVESGIFVVYQVKNADVVKKLYGRLHYGELEVIIGAKELDVLRKSGYRISDKLYYSVLEQNGELNEN